MTNRKSTKRALLGSVVAMVLCLVHRHRIHRRQQDSGR